jgi:CHAT domain-containing protein
MLRQEILITAFVLLICCIKSSAQDQLPLTLPKTPDAVDKQGKKQGYWFVSENEYGMATVDFYKDNLPIRRYEYYDNKQLYWTCGLKDGKTQGLLQYFTDGNLAQLQWEESGVTDFLKSIEVTEKKLAEVTAKHGKMSNERGLWLLNVATFLNGVGRYRQAEALYVESLEILKVANVDKLTIRATTGALIDFYLENGMYNKALRLLPKQISLEKSDERVYFYYRELEKLATCYRMLQMKDSAIATSQKIFDYRLKDIEKDSIKDYEYVLLYNSWYRLAIAKDDSVLIEKMIAHGGSVWNERSDNYNNHILDPAFRFYRDREKYSRAWELLNRAVAIQSQIPDNTWYIGWNPDIADLYHREKKFEAAARKYEEVLAIYDDKGLEKNTYEYLNYHWKLAEIHDEWGKTLKARHWYNTAVKLSRAYTDVYAISHINALRRLGNHLINNNLVDDGEEMLLDALSKAAEFESEDGATYLSILISMGESYSSAGLSAKAENIYLKVRDSYERNYGKDHIEYANILRTLGGLYAKLGMFDKGRQFLHEALSLTEREYGADNMRTAGIVNDLLAVYHSEYSALKQKSSLEKMGEYAAKYLDIIGRFEGPGSDFYAVALNQMGLFYQYKGFYRKAEGLFSEAKGIYDSLKLKNTDHNYHTFLHNIALTNQKMGNFEEASAMFVTAIDYKLKFGRHPTLVSSYRCAGITEWRRNNLKAAQSNLKIALDLQLKRLEDLSFLTEAERELFWESFAGDIDDYKAFLTEYAGRQKNMSGELFNVVMNTKAQLLRASTKWNQKIKASKDTAIVQAFTEWEELKSVVARNAIVENKQDESDSIQLRVQALEKFLTTETAYFGKIKPDPVFDWKAVRARLKKNEAVLEIMRVEKRGTAYLVTDSSDNRLPTYPYFEKTDTVFYVALIVKHNSKFPEMVVMTNGNEMEHYEKGFTNMVKGRIGETRSFDLFWKPFHRSLKNVSKVYFSPDGIYNTINVNILFNPATKKYLIDEKDIIYVGTVRDLLIASNTKYEGTENIVVVARPKFDLNVSTQEHRMPEESPAYVKTFYQLPRNVTRGAEELDDLPATGREALNIAGELQPKGWKTQLFLDEEASEENVKHIRSPKVLHIATHGFFWPQDAGIRSNPLLRSGLLLAGAKKTLEGNRQSAVRDKREDGVLTAYEVKELDLGGTDLVVLSACETGLGNQKNGEGVYGLQRSFIIAGAKTLIMSLWKVGDESTSELMTLFYKNWSNGESKITAFKNAQLKLREKFSDPVDWGGFVLVGTD